MRTADDREVLLAVRRAQREAGKMGKQLSLDEDRLDVLEGRIDRLERILADVLDLRSADPPWRDVPVNGDVL